MQSRPFGNTGLHTSELGFGCARIGAVFEGASRRDLLQLLRRAYDSGITFFDTADMYTQGESERMVGEALRDVRQHVIIATKGGYLLPAQKRLISRIKPLVKPIVVRLGLRPARLAAAVRGTVSAQNFSPMYLAQAVDASLKRLRTDYIDVYQLHSPPVDAIERGEFVDALESLRTAGKIRHWGIACDGPDEALAALHQPVQAIQIGMSALEQAALDAAIPQAARRGVGVIGRQVFASGLLTRPLDSVSVPHLDRDPAVAQRKHEQLERYASIARQSGRDPANLAVQFALAQPGVSTVLLGRSRRRHLDEAVRALQAPPLSSEEADLLVAARRVGR